MLKLQLTSWKFYTCLYFQKCKEKFKPNFLTNITAEYSWLINLHSYLPFSKRFTSNSCPMILALAGGFIHTVRQLSPITPDGKMRSVISSIYKYTFSYNLSNHKRMLNKCFIFTLTQYKKKKIRTNNFANKKAMQYWTNQLER